MLRRTGLQLTLLLGLLLALAAGSAYYVRNWSLVQLNEQTNDRLLAHISQLRAALDKYRYLPFVMTQSREVKALLRSDGYATGPQSNRVDRYLEQMNLVAGSSALFILDLQGNTRASSNWRDQQALMHQPQSDRRFFREAIEGNEGREFVHEGQPAIPALYLSAPIYDQQSLIGVAAMRLELDKLKSQLSVDYPYALSDKQGALLFGVDTPWPLQTVSTEALYDGSEVCMFHDGNQLYMMQSVVLDDLNWRITVLNDARAVVARERITISVIGIGGAALLLFLLLIREKRQRQALQREQLLERARSEERQRDMISTAEVGLINIDPNGNIEFLNPMAMRLFGVQLAEMKGRSLERLLQVDRASETLRLTLKQMPKAVIEPIISTEMFGQRADGEPFPMMLTLRGMAHYPQLGYLVTVIDISRRKRLEQALREANESLEQKVRERTLELENTQAELVQAGKLAALGRMSASVVHELNQPLTAARTYLAISQRLLNDPQALSANLSELQSLIDRMALITSQLKTFAYKKPEQLHPVRIAASIEQVLAMFRGRFAEMQLQPSYQPPPSALSILGDKARFEQIMINLVKNACDAMQTETKAHQLCIDVEEADTRIIIRVTDNGPGISAAAQAQLFEPFFTTKEIGSGLGLGLAIVQSMLRDIGGEIDARNIADGGACFTLNLPKAE